MHPALDRAHSHATDLSRLRIRQALRPNQDQSFPMLDRELSQSRTQVRKITPCSLFRDRHETVSIRPGWVLYFAMGFPILAVERVTQDREQPRIHAGARLKPLDVGPCPQDGLLHEIVCRIYIVGQRDREGP